ncbi:MAG: hypothetical protein CVU55_01645 [Deltaproteobacteria bacterium HGW-Deltaproteobacteria-13]|jgi:prepilin-type N-terminal cleavage/methylation domain-containing protein|nr:MAG: hypothetical protein CVU55_01645 [Deltaproteobacteria bacterium HGW-Deltaproteobacteria-13]
MNKNGFTLVELIVAIAVGSLIMLAIYSLSEMGQRSSASLSKKIITQQDTRAVLDIMAMEIRMVSYNPKAIDAGIWVDKDSAVVGAANSNKFMKGIQIANKNEIMIEMDLNSNGTVYDATKSKCEENEVLHYKYDSADKTISRETGCGGAGHTSGLQKILGGAGSDTMVVNNDVNPAVNLFSYWGPDIANPDANHNCADIDITDKVIADPVKWIPQIRYIVITIVADTEQADATTKQKRRMTYSTGVVVRNHVLSVPIPST